MRISQKIFFTAVTIIAITSLSYIIIVQNSIKLAELFNKLLDSEIPSLTRLIEIKASARQASLKVIEYSNRGDTKDKAKALKAIDELNGYVSDYINTEKDDDRTPQNKLNELILQAHSFIKVTENHLQISKGPSLSQLIEDETKLHEDRKKIIKHIKVILASNVNSEPVFPALILERIKSEARKISLKSLEFYLRGNKNDKDKAIDAINNLSNMIQKNVRQLGVGPEVTELEALISIYLESATLYLNDISNRKSPVSAIYLHEKELHKSRKTLIHSLYDLIALEKAEVIRSGNDYKDLISFLITMTITIALFLILLIITLNLIIFKSISRPIDHLITATKKIGAGDLDTIINISSNDEIKVLADSFNLMTNKLKSSRTKRLQALARLQKNKQDLAITLDSIGDAVIATNSDGIVKRMNQIAEKLTGWSLEEAKGQSVKSIFPIIDATTREPIANPIERVLATGEIVYLTNHTTLIARHGAEYQIADSAAPICDADGIIQGMVLVFNDVTEQYRLREKAKDVHKQLQGLLDNMLTMVAILETDGTIVFTNKAPLVEIGFEPDDILGNKFWDISTFSYDSNLQSMIKESITQTAMGKNVLRKDIQIWTQSGLSWVDFCVYPVFNEENQVVRLLVEGRDISERKLAEEKTLYQAHYDDLTKLPNRFLSLDRLSQFINKARRSNEMVAVLFLDLDDFKKINDTLGHETGDKLLIEAANRLQSGIRSEDTVGRLGGDEFIILLSGLKAASDAQPVAENLLNMLRNLFVIDDRELILTVSIGIAIYPNDGDNTSDLLRNSDTAMYHAKELGRNAYCYYTHTMNKDVSRRLLLEEQMHGSLKRGEFEVFYQPKVNIVNGDITGAEALLRWHNPVLGHISPIEFIPIAEHTGFIVALGKFVITEALNKTAHWQKDYDSSFCIAINLSPRQFSDPELVSFIKKSLQQHNISGEFLELEITEGVLMGGQSYIDDALSALNNLDIKIAMDDFGTGYSSLSYLRRYPFDVLKIDKSFINDISISAEDRELINAIIAMAHSLHLKVVAEGVETKEQLAYLQKLGCDYGQGYFFGRPSPAKDMENLFAVH